MEQALQARDKYLFTGIGLMFTEESEIIGLDIDNCLVNGKPNNIAAAILKKCPPTYVEISPSGTGLHIFLRGRLPPGGNRNSTHGVEMYGKARYFTMTGKRWLDCANEIADDNGALSWIHSQYILKKPRQKARVSSGISTLTDEKLLELAAAARDGAQFNLLSRKRMRRSYGCIRNG